MPGSNKEYDGAIFDQISLAERLYRAYKRNDFEEEYRIAMHELNRKLYIDPPLREEERA